jgi:hypothetical protein
MGLWYEGNEFERSSGRHLLRDMDGRQGIDRGRGGS